MRPAELLRKYVEAHNEIVRDGASRELAPLFEEDAVMRFEGISAGPFVGRDAIVRAIHDRPPSDELDIGRILEDDVRAIAPYGWKHSRDIEGEIVIVKRTWIAELVVRR